MRRRTFVLGSLALVSGGCAATLSDQDRAAVDALGHFEHIPGRAGVVVSAPHGTADTGTLALATDIRGRTGASGVFVTGFWDSRTRRRINVNRDTEETIGAESQVMEQAYSARAAHINARYTSVVRQASQGPLRWFFEIHSNSYPQYQGSVEVSTLGVTVDDARRFKDAFLSGRDRRLPATAPQLGINVAPADNVRFKYRGASSISYFSQRGFLVETPSRVMRDATWRARYGEVLAELIMATVG